jgi:uncharacterized protein YjbI with pentapeptide repeats
MDSSVRLIAPIIMKCGWLAVSLLAATFSAPVPFDQSSSELPAPRAANADSPTPCREIQRRYGPIARCADGVLAGSDFAKRVARPRHQLELENMAVSPIHIPLARAAVHAKKTTFYFVGIGHAERPLTFEDCLFHDDLSIASPARLTVTRSRLWRDLILRGAFRDGAILTATKVNRSVHLSDASFLGRLDLTGLNVRLGLQFGPHGRQTLPDVSFKQARLEGVVVLRRLTFSREADFTDALLENSHIESCHFTNAPRLVRTVFAGKLSLDGSVFSAGLDLRRANLDGVMEIDLDGVSVSPERFLFRWEQFKGSGGRARLSPRLDDGDRLSTAQKEDRLNQLERLYTLVIESLEASGQDLEADEARFELAERKKNLAGGFWRRAYGLFLGYGYRPWRIAWLIVPLVLLFAFLFALYQTEVMTIVSGEVRDGRVEVADVNRFVRWLHLLLFSASVLLSIRLKHDWLPARTPLLVLLVVTEWALGIMLYVAFFALVRTPAFAYIKGLLGF